MAKKKKERKKGGGAMRPVAEEDGDAAESREVRKEEGPGRGTPQDADAIAEEGHEETDLDRQPLQQTENDSVKIISVGAVNAGKTTTIGVLKDREQKDEGPEESILQGASAEIEGERKETDPNCEPYRPLENGDDMPALEMTHSEDENGTSQCKSAGNGGGGRETTEVNDTLKIIFVGMAYAGKTTLIRRLRGGPDVDIPRREERTIGVDLMEWDPSQDWWAHHGMHCDARIVQEGNHHATDAKTIKFSVWDFAGQDVYHATHEIFFSPNALYILVWDMGASNPGVRRRPKVADIDDGWEDSSEEEDEEVYTERETLRAERALERDIDERVTYWVNCIQSRVPGAAILPVASYDDFFDSEEKGGHGEAIRRCNKMKERLLNHEKRRVKGLEQRLEELRSNHRANSEEASRIRELLSPFHRPKLIFGSDGCVPRVSGKDSRGFTMLRRNIINVASGREPFGAMKRPAFRGHIGAVIPTVRAKIRMFIGAKKSEKKLQVIEWKHFLVLLEEYLGFPVDNDEVCDALRFCHAIGDISYFGGKMRRNENADDESSDEEDASFFQAKESNDWETRFQTQDLESREKQKKETANTSRLSQFIFLDPKWLAATMGCILRHDLRNQIEETRYFLLRNMDPSPRWQGVGRGDSFHEANRNCPIITSEEACMLWKARKKILKAAERSKLDSVSSSDVSPFRFMQQLLVHFNVFVPIDLHIDKVFLAGQDFSTNDAISPAHSSQKHEETKFFFLPSQLSPWDSSDKTWTYKCGDSWKTCLCHSWLFPDGSPPGLLEHVTASVLRDLYAVTCSADAQKCGIDPPDYLPGLIGHISFREILCWQTAFNLVLGKFHVGEDGDLVESRVEVWVHLVDEESPYCVAGNFTGVGMRRLVVSAKGEEGNGCRKIWEGGYEAVLKAVERVIEEYRGLEVSKQGVCPDCLASRDIRHAQTWDWTRVQDTIRKGPGTITCGNGHRIDVRYVGGRVKMPRSISDESDLAGSCSRVPFSELYKGVVLVGLWDGEEEQIVACGSGFVVDKKRGLIVTASHTLIDMINDCSFGSDYHGLKHGRAVIGVIPENGEAGTMCSGPEAYFRYFAEIVAKDPRNVDACILQITSRIETDIGGDGSKCGQQRFYPLIDMEEERLQKLKCTRICEYEEEVRILGFNQGGEGLTDSPCLNRVIEVVKGHVVKIYKARNLYSHHELSHQGFRPRMEIVINCQTIGGHSGGPCVNQSGKVIGILSREDPEDKSRCYLVPTNEFWELVNVVKSWEN